MPYRILWILGLMCWSHTWMVYAKAQDQHRPWLCKIISTKDTQAQDIADVLPTDRLGRWLWGMLFQSPKPPKRLPDLSVYQLYEGKCIRHIVLQKASSLAGKQIYKRWRRLGHRLMPITHDKVLLRALTFQSGDRLAIEPLQVSYAQLSQLPQIAKQALMVQPVAGTDSVDVVVVTQDRIPITFSGSLAPMMVGLAHRNLWGWGHKLQQKLWLKKGWQYEVSYLIPHLGSSTLVNTWTWQLVRQHQKCRLDGQEARQKFDTKHYKPQWWLCQCLALASDRQTSWTWHWTSGIAYQYFKKRPIVGEHTNRLFHHELRLSGSIGLAWSPTQAPNGSGGATAGLISLGSGYQIGEYAHRPYVRLDAKQYRSWPQSGQLIGRLQIGGFWHQGQMEQLVEKFRLDGTTPFYKVGRYQFQSSFTLDAQLGQRLFTGEQVKVYMPRTLHGADIGLWGTQRWGLYIDTLLASCPSFRGCQVMPLTFASYMCLKARDGKALTPHMLQSWGLGLQVAHPRFAWGTIQLRWGYCWLSQQAKLDVALLTPQSVASFSAVEAPDALRLD